MLKMKTPDTIIPTVYRVGQVRLISSRSEPKEANRDDDKARPLPTPPMPTVIFNERAVPEAQPTQEQEYAMETNTSSPESSMAGFTLPPLALDPRTDLFREFWPRVNEELRRLPRHDHTRTTSQERDMNVGESNASDTSATTPVDPFRDPEPKHIKVESPDLSAQALLSRPVTTVHLPEMVQSTVTPATTLNISLATLLDNYRSSSPDFSAPLATSVSSMEGTPQSETAPSIPSTPALQPTQLITAPLKATFLTDTTVPDGQMFPPGAEFVKSWRMMNDGPTDWPESTELHYAAGEKFSLESMKVKVGKVAAGVQVDVWTGELKVMNMHLLSNEDAHVLHFYQAPETAGQYRGYWRLSDGEGSYFGHSLWVECVLCLAILLAVS
jgi:next-to-BRCA1 protein 1